MATTLVVGIDVLRGICELDGLDGLEHLAEAFSTSDSENREICCMTTRPMDVQWEGEPGILLKVEDYSSQKLGEDVTSSPSQFEAMGQESVAQKTLQITVFPFRIWTHQLCGQPRHHLTKEFC